MPLPPECLCNAWAYRAPSVRPPLVNSPCPAQAASTGWYHTVPLLPLIFSHSVLSPPAHFCKVGPMLQSGSRIISILQVRRPRLREEQSLTQGHTAGVSGASKPYLSYNHMRFLEGSRQGSFRLDPPTSRAQGGSCWEAGTFTSLPLGRLPDAGAGSPVVLTQCFSSACLMVI